MDRISSLPNEIICHIGSFLSAKEAAFTTVLSKRWRNLFTIIPNLHFDCSVKNGESFTEFTDRVFGLPISSRVRKFSLKCKFVGTETAQCDLVNLCLCHVLKLGVLVLKLEINVKDGYSLPLEIFTCETVTKLKLGSGFVIDYLPENAYLPSLKTLFLDSIRFYEFGRCAFNMLLSVSPKIEELVIDGVEFERWKWSFTVSSPTLQRLTIQRKEWYSYDNGDVETVRLDARCLAHEFNSLSLDIPAVTYLEYADYVPKEYLIVNLDSLVEAKLDLFVDEESVWQQEHAEDFDPMNLINALKNVKILNLNIYTTEMFYVFHKEGPVFENLFRISLGLSNFCWYSVPNLIKKSPNLKTLIFEDSLHYDLPRGNKTCVCECVSEYSFLLSCPVEVLKIMEYRGTIEELEQMKHFLEKLSCLELVEVRAQVNVKRQVQVMADLLMLPRASSRCKIQVQFS